MNVLVIGNGFDLNLGLPTRYYDFAQSDDWKALYCGIDKDTDNLASYLYKLAEEDKTWFDIEKGLTMYVHDKESKRDYSKTVEDESFFKKLAKSLGDYLDEMIWENSDKYSLAYRMSEVINDGNYFDGIYSFNYLQYENMWEVEIWTNPVFVHNDLSDPVIGIAEDESVSRKYSFLKKSNHYPPLNSTNIIGDLEKADEVVIFGHSVNPIDKIYFEDFFMKSSEETGRIPKKRITIITLNESSMRTISDNIADMGVSITRLRSNCELEFITTDEPFSDENNEKIRLLLERIKNG